MDRVVERVFFPPKPLSPHDDTINCQKVAVYARVSTGSDEQLNSIEAQKDYYTKLTALKSEWVLYELYADEGVSGLVKTRRDAFNRMMDDAISGKFTLIITKSISRFARNTVDTLTCIRKLKSVGCEVWFEKEDIWSFDSKGEFMLTLLSVIAQEESRSISENVKWGYRKRFADGKYNMPYAHFLGYKKGADGQPAVVEEEAQAVRLIYRLFLYGQTPNGIARYLESQKIPSPGGKEKWQASTVESILTNEKYKGDALLQKRFSVDYLQKKMKINEGELPQYYVTNGHEAIIPRRAFDFAQEQWKQRKERFGRSYSNVSCFSSKIVCCYCGRTMCIRSGHGDSYWTCRDGLRKPPQCPSHYIPIEQMNAAHNKAFMLLLKEKAQFLESFLRLLSPEIHRAKKRIHKKDRLEAIGSWLDSLCGSAPPMLIFDNDLSYVLIERISVHLDCSIDFMFCDGSIISMPDSRNGERYKKSKSETQSKIVELRKQGVGYGRIAETLGISKNTVASFCRRHNED